MSDSPLSRTTRPSSLILAITVEPSQLPMVRLPLTCMPAAKSDAAPLHALVLGAAAPSAPADGLADLLEALAQAGAADLTAVDGGLAALDRVALHHVERIEAELLRHHVDVAN